jgi:hypothetical protein
MVESNGGVPAYSWCFARQSLAISRSAIPARPRWNGGQVLSYIAVCGQMKTVNLFARCR